MEWRTGRRVRSRDIAFPPPRISTPLYPALPSPDLSLFVSPYPLSLFADDDVAGFVLLLLFWIYALQSELIFFPSCVHVCGVYVDIVIYILNESSIFTSQLYVIPLLVFIVPPISVPHTLI
jgi:hypothetical protein